MNGAFAHWFIVPEPIVRLGLCLKVTAIMSIARVVAWRMREAAAADRHRVWVAAIASALALVLGGPLAPRLPVRLPLAVVPPGFSTAAPMASFVPRLHATTLVALLRIGSTLWLAGALAILLRTAAGHVRAHHLVRRALPLGPRAVRGLEMRVPVRISAAIDAPVTCGVFRPVIILPERAMRWSTGRLRAVLEHERAHVERRDPLRLAVAQIVAVLFWFDPQVAFAVRQLRWEAERACDDRVLLAGCPARTYARHLLEIARACPRAPAFGVGMAGHGDLARRVAAVLDPRQPRVGGDARAAWLALTVWLTALVPLTGMRTHL